MTETTSISPESDKPTLFIEGAKPEDAEAVTELLRLTWMATYPNAEAGITEEDIRRRTEGENGERISQNIERWRKSIETTDGSRAVYVARIDGKVVGVAAPSYADSVRRLGALYVLPDMQGKGIGGKLMQKALTWHGDNDDIFLNVASYNQNAINFYRSYGFEQTDKPVIDEGNVYGKTLIPEIEMVRKAEVKEQLASKEMTSRDVVELVMLLEQNDIEVYIDGGWGIDALLAEQTRKHGDLDIALPHKYVPNMRKLLEAKGYKDVPRNDTRDCNFVLGDDKGHEVDVHSYTFDADGNNIFGVAYEPRHLTGTGSINGYPVKCIPADVMVEFHSGYELDDNDYRDIKAICERFNIPLPDEYKKFVEKEQK